MSFLETDKYYIKKLRGKKSRKQLEDKVIRQFKARINRTTKIIESEEDSYNPIIIGNLW